jgi:uncharacterized protein YlzI (FlbEa/FlbD family)
VIAVTCRNGEHFTLNPDAIERVEDRGDTWVFLEDGTKYCIGQTIEELIRIMAVHRAAALSARRGLGGRLPATELVPGSPPRRADPEPLVSVTPRPAAD